MGLLGKLFGKKQNKEDNNNTRKKKVLHLMDMEATQKPIAMQIHYRETGKADIWQTHPSVLVQEREAIQNNDENSKTKKKVLNPMEKTVIRNLVEGKNKNFMEPSARVTYDETGKADVWLANKKWADYNHQGIELKNSGRYRDAIEKFDEAINEEPKAGIPHHGKADALLKMGDYEGALKESNTAISLDKRTPEVLLGKPTILEFYFRKIQALLGLGRYEDILEPEMEEYLMTNDPEGYEKGRNNAREFLTLFDKMKDSKLVTSKAEMVRFNEQMNKVFNLVKSSNLSSALVEVEKAIAMNSKDASAHVTKGLIIIGLKNTGKRKDDFEAAKEFSIAIALDPRDPNTLFMLGLSALAGGDHATANVRFVRVKFLDPNYITNKKIENYKPFVYFKSK